MKSNSALLALITIMVAGMVGAAGIYTLNTPANGGGALVPDDEAGPGDNETGPPVPIIPDDGDKTIPDDKNKTVPDDGNKTVPDPPKPTPVPVPDPKPTSVTLTGDAKHTVSKTFMIKKGVTVFHFDMNNGVSDVLQIWLNGADGSSELFIDPHNVEEGGHYGPYVGDRAQAFGGAATWGDPGVHWFNVTCNGTWKIVVEQSVSKGRNLPQYFASSGDKLDQAFSIRIPADAKSLKLTLDFDGESPVNKHIFVWMFGSDGTSYGQQFGQIIDYEGSRTVLLNNCYYQKGAFIGCDPGPGVYWLTIHAYDGVWSLTVELV